MKHSEYNSSELATIPGSFRDPKGSVAKNKKDEILRILFKSGYEAFQEVDKTGIYEKLIKSGKLVAHEKIETDLPEGAQMLLKHPTIPVISYPYEWCFEQLKAAALLQLDVYLDALSSGITLSDATAYNIQFDKSKPCFIDTLSFEPYEDGAFWTGQEQFTEQYLNPLILRAYGGLTFNDIYRGSLTGVTSDIIRATTPFYRKVSFRYFNYIYLPHASKQRFLDKGNNQGKKIKGKLPKEGFIFILKGLRKWIEGLEDKKMNSVWSDYEGNRSYEEESLSEKKQFVSKHVSTAKPGRVLDIGCNMGEFSFLALESGAKHAVGLEFDHQALSVAYLQSVKKQANFLPLYQNMLNPSPSQGWESKERESLTERVSADFVLALAIIHHIAISGNVPLSRVISYITNFAKQGVIEWVPKTDPMIKALLFNREDIFDTYTEEVLNQSLIDCGCKVEEKKEISNGRVLYYYTNA